MSHAAGAARPGKAVYLAVFLIALSTLMYELLLTRIFSVTVYYHFAFMALSIAMFGLSAGGILVFMLRDWFFKRDLLQLCAANAAGLAITAVLAVLLHINVPLMDSHQTLSLNILVTYAAITLPFLFSGIVLSLIFTHFAAYISELYAADLLGASVGCFALLWCLRVFDGLSAVLLVSVLAAASGLCFSISSKRKTIIACLSLTALLIAALVANTTAYDQGHPLMRISWAKGAPVAKPLYEKWNSFSWIAVSGDPQAGTNFTYPGISGTYKPDHLIHGLNLDIDGAARTTLVGRESDLNRLDVFRSDVANVAHYLRPHADVLVIGAGGGKDLVSALVFDQKHVTGVEINENTLNAVNNVFGEFTGHLDRNPKVSFVNDEARSYLSRHDEHYDIIQMPFIDTWAATTNGAYVLAENSLYTVEAWKVFLSRLNDHGIFTVSRWYAQQGHGEILRMVALAAEALRESGVQDPRRNIVLIRNLTATGPDAVGVGTILISVQPFTADDLTQVAELCKRYKYDLVVSPDYAEDPQIAKIAGGNDLESVASKLPINIRPSFDDSPFFFNMLRPIDLFNPHLAQFTFDANLQAVLILYEVLVISLSATYLCIYIPAKFGRVPPHWKVSNPLVGFFLFIGIAFMCVEISQIQRLIVFLGHPVYGITVVFGSLLLASGIGSYCSRITGQKAASRQWKRLLPIVIALAAIGVVAPAAIAFFRHSETAVRIGTAVVMICSAGFFMGMAFPIGLTVASRDNQDLSAWYWGINGAGSVTGSVLAIIISLDWGITTLYWCAIGFYVAAMVALARAERALEAGVQ